MIFYFGPVVTYSTTGKTAKGKALQELALRFKDVLVRGDTATIAKIVSALRDQAAAIDKNSRGGVPTFVSVTFDNRGDSGQIDAVPASDSGRFNERAYFRITFKTAAALLTGPEAIALAQKGGAL